MFIPVAQFLPGRDFRPWSCFKDNRKATTIYSVDIVEYILEEIQNKSLQAHKNTF